MMVGQDEDQLQEPEKETLVLPEAELLSTSQMYAVTMVSAEVTERFDTLYRNWHEIARRNVSELTIDQLRYSITKLQSEEIESGEQLPFLNPEL